MNNFNLSAALEIYGQELDLDWLAETLFPKNKHPKIAFARVLKNEADLSVPQLELLAECLGVMPQSLFGLSEWEGKTGPGVITLTKDGYTARILETENNIATIYKDGSLLTTIIIPGAPTIKDFIQLINNTIIKYHGTNQN